MKRLLRKTHAQRSAAAQDFQDFRLPEPTGYAYETIPNKPIIAGKTTGPDVITLQPGTLGSLALGAK